MTIGGWIIIKTLVDELINTIVGCTFLICGTILLLIYWPLAILVILLGFSILFDLVDFNKYKKSQDSNTKN